MKFFRLDLLTLLISLFILNSCKNQTSVGLNINPNQMNGAMVDTSTIVINTVPDDSVVTSGGLAKNPLAFFNDPVFGTTVANIATDINLPGSAAYTLPSGTIIVDSARLVLKLADGFYGDSLTSKYTVNVYTMNEKINGGTTYYNTRQWNYNSSNLVGSLTFNARPEDSIKIYNIIAGAPDTLMKVQPQIRIPINANYINSILFTANSTTLSSNAIFQNNNKGLYITLDQKKTTGPGGVFMVAPSDSIAIYYRTLSGPTVDTAVVYLPINEMISNISHTYTATIQGELNNTTSGSRNTFYLQGMAGLRAKISFPKFLANLRGNLLKKDSDIVINRAELVVTPRPGSNIPFIPAPKLTMYELDIAHQRAQIEDASSGDPRGFGVGSFGGYYNPNIQQYHFLLTAHFQDILLNRIIDYGTYIGVVDNTNTSSVDIASTSQAAARTVAVGTDNSSPSFKITLNVIYTKVALKQ